MLLGPGNRGDDEGLEEDCEVDEVSDVRRCCAAFALVRGLPFGTAADDCCCCSCWALSDSFFCLKRL